MTSSGYRATWRPALRSDVSCWNRILSRGQRLPSPQQKLINSRQPSARPSRRVCCAARMKGLWIGRTKGIVVDAFVDLDRLRSMSQQLCHTTRMNPGRIERVTLHGGKGRKVNWSSKGGSQLTLAFNTGTPAMCRSAGHARFASAAFVPCTSYLVCDRHLWSAPVLLNRRVGRVQYIK